MSGVKVVCDRCSGAGVVYTRVHNGVPIPAQPDAGVCYKCHGDKVVEPTLGEQVKERIEAFSKKHAIQEPFSDFYKDKDYVYLYTRKVVLRFAKYKDEVKYQPR